MILKTIFCEFRKRYRSEKKMKQKKITILFVYEKNYNLCSRLRVASNKFVQVNWDLIIEPLNEIHIIPFPF